MDNGVPDAVDNREVSATSHYGAIATDLNCEDRVISNDGYKAYGGIDSVVIEKRALFFSSLLFEI